LQVSSRGLEVSLAFGGGRLEALDYRTSLALVMLQRSLDGALLVERRRQGDRVLHREFGTRSNREVRGVSSIAEEDDVAVTP
jgi:hypothetical protein